MSIIGKTDDTRAPISCFTITQNAADCAGFTIREMCMRFQEVNVVVAPSEDATEAIVYGLEAEFPGTLNVQLHDFDTHSAQYQRALDMCTRDWCLQLSSDEFLLPGTDWEKLMNVESDFRDGYRFSRYFCVYGLGYYNSSVYPDIGLRFVRNGKAEITAAEIHEALRLTGPCQRDRIGNIAEHIIDIGDIRTSWHLGIKSVSRHRWYSGDLYNRDYFKRAVKEGGIGNTFQLRKTDGHKFAKPFPPEYAEYMQRMIPVGSAIWKELPCRQSA